MADRSSTELDAAGRHRARIVEGARAWIGTPYHHQASCRGAGCDCLGLLRGVWRDLIGPEPEPLPAYSADWGDITGEETLLAVCRKHLLEVAPSDMQPADVLVFRVRRGRIAKHCGVLATASTFIHAIESAPVAEVPLGEWWRARIVAAFSFPMEAM